MSAERPETPGQADLDPPGFAYRCDGKWARRRPPRPSVASRVRTWWRLNITHGRPVRRLYYQWRWGIETHGHRDASLLPILGRGRFVSVHRRGSYLDIEAHGVEGRRAPGLIRLVPWQPNHGVMIEYWENGALRWRTHAGYDQLKGMGWDVAESPVPARVRAVGPEQVTLGPLAAVKIDELARKIAEVVEGSERRGLP